MDGKPESKLAPTESPPEPRVLGGDRGKIWVADDAFEPMTGEELADWHEGPIFPSGPSPELKKRPKANARSGRRPGKAC